MSGNPEKQLIQCRDRIDEIDNRILELMRDRLQVAKNIATIKEGMGEPAYYRPEREAQVLRRLKKRKPDQMSDQDVEALYRIIISITRNYESGMSVSLMGPEDSDSELAARRLLGDEITVVHAARFSELTESVESGNVDLALVEIQNSSNGVCGNALDMLANTSLSICAEIRLPVNHNLLSLASGRDGVRQVVAMPEILEECQWWLDRNLDSVERFPCRDRLEGIRRALENSEVATIARKDLALWSNLNVLGENIQSAPMEMARFVVLSARETPPSGHDKTSFLLSTPHSSTTLDHFRTLLIDHDIRIENVHTGTLRSGGHGEVGLLVDVKGHRTDPGFAEIMEVMQTQAGLFRCLGSFPVSC